MYVAKICRYIEIFVVKLCQYLLSIKLWSPRNRQDRVKTFSAIEHNSSRSE